MGGQEHAPHPTFDPRARRAVGAQFYSIGATDRKSVFEDKVAISPVGQYNEGQKQEWVKTTSNYLVSKAFEMAAFLPWAESAQAHPITHEHVNALTESGYMVEVEPLRLSKDLWGYLNLAITDKKQTSMLEARNRLIPTHRKETRRALLQNHYSPDRMIRPQTTTREPQNHRQNPR